MTFLTTLSLAARIPNIHCVYYGMKNFHIRSGQREDILKHRSIVGLRISYFFLIRCSLMLLGYRWVV